MAGSRSGQSATDGDWKELLLGEQNFGGWLLAGLLFAWQFRFHVPELAD